MQKITSNSIAIRQIELALFSNIPQGSCYNIYNAGRGSCGLIIAVSGEAYFEFTNGNNYKITAGQAALLSDSAAYVVSCTGTNPFVHYVINFSPVQGTTFSNDIFIKPVNFDEFSKKAKQLITLWNSGAPMSDLRSLSVLYELIADLFESNLIDHMGADTYHSVLPAIHYIDKNYSSTITVSFLAQLCMMSTTNFRRMFTALCGTSPIQYLLDVRIRHAKELLNHGVASVTETAQKCGFKDVEHFCRTFKKRTGSTPAKFKNIF